MLIGKVVGSVVATRKNDNLVGNKFMVVELVADMGETKKIVAIDNIGATKGLCLNVTYSFWSVFFALILSIFLPQYFSGALSLYIAIGSLLVLGGVTMATLYKTH